MRIIFILQRAAKEMAGQSRKKGGCVLVCCLPGGLAAVLIAKDVLVPRPCHRGSGAQRRVWELTDRDDCKRLDYLALFSSHKIPWRGESSKSHQRRVWLGFSSTAGWGLGAPVHSAPPAIHCGSQLKSPSLGQENQQSCRMVVPWECQHLRQVFTACLFLKNHF